MLYLLLLLWFPLTIVTEDPSQSQNCLFRCTANCLVQQKNNTVQQCKTECKVYNDSQLCNSTDWSCWEMCKDLSSAISLKAISGFELRQENLTTILSFHPVEEATFYVVQYQLSQFNISSPQYEITTQPFITNQMRPTSMFCDRVMTRVAAVSPSGTGPFSESFLLDAPQPLFTPRLELLTMVYLDIPYGSGSYSDNGTVEVIFKYKVGACDNVKNSPCMHTPPICGRIDDIHQEVTDEHSAPDEEMSLSLNITFDPIVRKDEPPTIYYKAFYGEALPYPRQAEEALAGVNITRIIGNTTNCLKFDHRGYCLEYSNNSVSISGIRYDKIYGITFCAIKDPSNLMVPELVGDSMVLKPRASKVYVTKGTSNVKVIIAIVGGAVALLIVIMAICCYINRKQKQKVYQL